MSSVDWAKALTEFWSAQAGSAMKAQEAASRSFAEHLQAMAGAMTGSGDVSTGATELGRANQAMTELWTGASALAAQLAARLPASTSGDAAAQAVLGKIMDPRQWLTGAVDGDEMLGRMAEGPRLADLWQIERRYARVTQAMMDVRRRSLEHNVVMLDAWMQAGRAFAEAWGGRTGTAAADGKAALDLWTATANQHLLATQRSEAFLTTQREMIRANTALRLAQRELVEYFGEQYGFPTRTELDDVHLTLTELRRELRAMRRQRREPAATPAPAVTVPVRRQAANRK